MDKPLIYVLTVVGLVIFVFTYVNSKRLKRINQNSCLIQSCFGDDYCTNLYLLYAPSVQKELGIR